MAKQERKVILIGVSIVILALLIILIVNGVNKKESEKVGQNSTLTEQNTEKYIMNLENGVKLNNGTEFNKNKKYKNIEISNIQFIYENGKSVLLADVKNTANTKHESEIVTLIILDQNNQLLEKTNAIMPNLSARETKKMNVIISGVDSVNAKDFKIEEKK